MQQRGFTLSELAVATAVFMVVAAIGGAVLFPAITAAKADSQVARVIGALQLARDTAIARQRDVELTIDEDAGILRLARIEDGDPTPFLEIALESGVKFLRFADLGDTPDGFGGDGAVEFGDAARLLFISDGSLVGADDLPVNGSMFFAIDNQPESARAISVTGTTARARRYKRNNGEWITQ